MTGPNPDAELDAALGVSAPPPAAVTDDHLARATGLCSGPPGYRSPELVERIAQAIADAEQRGAARALAERAAAGTGAPVCPPHLPGPVYPYPCRVCGQPLPTF